MNGYRSRAGGVAAWTRGLLMAALALATGAAAGETPLVDANTRLAIVGDSITEQKLYSKYIEMYLMACAPAQPAAVAQFGWGGERAPGFAGRMAQDCLSFMPNLITTCYGMNDGSYRAYNNDIGKAYRDGMDRILKQAKEANAVVLVGGPGAVEPAKFKRGDFGADAYNANLAKLSGIAQELAGKYGFPFADVHAACMNGIAAAKKELGDDYVVMGNDGVHPGANGQLAMAYGFLEAMKFTGDIGAITVGLDENGAPRRAAATGEHDVEVKDGVVAVSSRRWPYCFTGRDSEQSTRAMQRFLPFNERLNRFVLRVENPGETRMEVKWGAARRVFSPDELKAGVNLAAAFAGETPFQAAWNALDRAVSEKQSFETWWIKSVRALARDVDRRTNKNPDAKKAADDLFAAVTPTQEQHAQKVRDAVGAVRHRIEIVPLTEQAIAERERRRTAPAPDLAAEGWRPLYDLDLNKGYKTDADYSANHAADVGAFSRVAYLLELSGRDGKTRWIAVELDAFSDRADKLGVPTDGRDQRFQQAAKNLVVRSNDLDVEAGAHAEGWLEFWPNNYAEKNVKNVPGASNSNYDWGDMMDGNVKNGYGSMQIHLPSASQVLFAVNNWRSGGNNLDVGIGNSPSVHPDYTFTKSGAQYPQKRLRVFVK